MQQETNSNASTGLPPQLNNATPLFSLTVLSSSRHLGEYINEFSNAALQTCYVGKEPNLQA